MPQIPNPQDNLEAFHNETDNWEYLRSSEHAHQLLPPALDAIFYIQPISEDAIMAGWLRIEFSGGTNAPETTWSTKSNVLNLNGNENLSHFQVSVAIHVDSHVTSSKSWRMHSGKQRRQMRQAKLVRVKKTGDRKKYFNMYPSIKRGMGQHS